MTDREFLRQVVSVTVLARRLVGEDVIDPDIVADRERVEALCREAQRRLHDPRVGPRVSG